VKEFKLTTPVAFIIFNRPETTMQVFEVIRKVKPETLLVIADGPRQQKEGEMGKCEETRKIIDSIDWECNLIKNYSDVNLGCKKRLSGGIDWVFNQFEEAIFLEDDCLPDISFFQFCQSLLEHYRDDEIIMNISGINFQFGKNSNGYSYYYSQFVHVWGWASWKRAWQHYDPEMKQWPEVKRQNLLDKYFNSPRAKKYWCSEFDRTFNGKIDTWDHQWTYACWLKNGLNIIPNVNLVSNIGFGTGAVHTIDSLSEFANIPFSKINFLLKHPSSIERNVEADNYTQEYHFSHSLIYRIKIKVKKLFSKYLFNFPI